MRTIYVARHNVSLFVVVILSVSSSKFDFLTTNLEYFLHVFNIHQRTRIFLPGIVHAIIGFSDSDKKYVCILALKFSGIVIETMVVIMIKKYGYREHTNDYVDNDDYINIYVANSNDNDFNSYICLKCSYHTPLLHMMTSSNGNIFRVTGHLCGGFTGEFPAQRPVTRSFDAFFDLCLNKRLRKQSWGWWFETLSRPLWRHCNEIWEWHVWRNR